MLDSNFNSRYKEAEQDILTIHEFANIEAVFKGGLDGYRARRYAAVGDANQSLKSNVEQKRFLKSCYRLYWNNLPLFLQD